mmetsp:Transcript_18158/g.27408  ORF Transcript_18158/g.27408 Transcript_18158/m.27408 type:complete len:229 (-) Transcript_18158:311-997(-)
MNELTEYLIAEIAIYAVPTPLEITCKSYRKACIGSAASEGYALLLEKVDPWLLKLIRKSNETSNEASKISSTFRDTLKWFGTSPRRIWICVKKTEYLWKNELHVSSLQWAEKWPAAIILRNAISRSLLVSYDSIQTILNAYAAFLSKPIKRWHLDLLEELCDSGIRVPDTQSGASFLLDALALIDSFSAYARLIQSPLRRFISDETAASLTDEVELAFDLRRAGRPYH